MRLRSRAGVIKDLAAARAALQAAEGGESEGVESDGEPEPEPEPEPAARPKQARGAARPGGGAADTRAKPGVKRTLAERRELKRQKREERARSKRAREEKRHAKLLKMATDTSNALRAELVKLRDESSGALARSQQPAPGSLGRGGPAAPSPGGVGHGHGEGAGQPRQQRLWQ